MSSSHSLRYATASRLSRLRVLILDDHANMRFLLRAILLGFGIRDVVETANALEALEVLEQTDVDIAIVDHKLEDLSGAEFVRMVRRSNGRASQLLPVIACTADTRRSTLSELVNSGVDEVLAKPVSATYAWQKLAAVVNSRRSFVRTSIYFGPDRRRHQTRYTGPERRSNQTVDL